MDLLRNDHDGGRLIAAAVAGSVLVLASCASPDRAAPETRVPPPAAQTSALTPLVLDPLDPGEQVVARRSGGGSKKMTVRAGSITNVYVICAGDAPVAVRILTSGAPSTLDVPCDRVVSRRQVYTNAGEDVSVLVRASGAEKWKALITRV